MSLLQSALLRSTSLLQAPCQLCARRYISKLRTKRHPTLEIELLKRVPLLGRAGDRVQVAPGMMRNHLFPKRMALYVLRGRTMGHDGVLRELPIVPEAVVLEQQKQVERIDTLRETMDRLVKIGAVRIEKRTTTRPRGKDKVVDKNLLYSSVSPGEIEAALQVKGVQLPPNTPGLLQSKGKGRDLEQGRIKYLGEYLYTVTLSDQQIPIIVHVAKKQ